MKCNEHICFCSNRYCMMYWMPVSVRKITGDRYQLKRDNFPSVNLVAENRMDRLDVWGVSIIWCILNQQITVHWSSLYNGGGFRRLNELDVEFVSKGPFYSWVGSKCLYKLSSPHFWRYFKLSYKKYDDS